MTKGQFGMIIKHGLRYGITSHHSRILWICLKMWLHRIRRVVADHPGINCVINETYHVTSTFVFTGLVILTGIHHATDKHE
ncbi:hypothetical protein D9M71_685000 [compost metagenome]